MIDSSSSSSVEKLEELSVRLTLKTGGLIANWAVGVAVLGMRTPYVFRQGCIVVLFLWSNTSNAVRVVCSLHYLCVYLQASTLEA